MNWDTVKGEWKQFKGKVKEQWGKLTDDDLNRIQGRRDQLAGAIEKRYGIEKDEAEKQVMAFEQNCGHCHEEGDRMESESRVRESGDRMESESRVRESHERNLDGQLAMNSPSANASSGMEPRIGRPNTVTAMAMIRKT